MKKVFIQTQFGTPHEWTQQYIDHVQHLEADGWYWKIFTANKLQSKGNVEIVQMSAEDFNDLTEKTTGIRSQVAQTERGIPNIHMTDFYIFAGVIWAEWLKDADFWGITNLDVVYGQLSSFFPDVLLEQTDIFTDDVNAINGVFSLWRNQTYINNLYHNIENWREVLAQSPCQACVRGGDVQHTLYGSDELGMTDVCKKLAHTFRYRYPSYYPMLSHDRLEQHVPTPKLEIKPDGTLWELFKDTDSPEWEHSRPMIGKEIPYFHFSRTKRWPL